MMHLYGCQPVCGSRTKGIIPSSGRSSSSSFMEELKKATEAAAAEKAKDTLELAEDNPSLQALRHQLTSGAKAVLDRIQAGTNDITKDEWNGLCGELESLEAISEADSQCTSAGFHLIPLGYWAEKELRQAQIGKEAVCK